MYLQRSIFSPFFLSFGGGGQPGRNRSAQAVGAEERKRRLREDAPSFLERLALREERCACHSGAGMPEFLQGGSQKAGQSQCLLYLGRGYCVAIKPVFKCRLQGDFGKFALPL